METYLILYGNIPSIAWKHTWYCMETYLILHDNTTNSMETQPIFHEQVCFYALLSMFPCTTTCRYVSMETYLICRTYLIVHGNSRWVVTINDVNYQQKYVQNIILAVQIGKFLRSWKKQHLGSLCPLEIWFPENNYSSIPIIFVSNPANH